METFDVESLFTNVPIEDAVKATLRKLEKLDYQGFGLVGRGHDVQKIAILSALTGRKNQNI